jgi:hypothetical protein
VGGRSEPQNEEPPVRIPEGGNGATPVRLVAEGGSPVTSDPLTPLDQARTRSTRRDGGLQLVELRIAGRERDGRGPVPGQSALAASTARSSSETTSWAFTPRSSGVGVGTSSSVLADFQRTIPT